MTSLNAVLVVVALLSAGVVYGTDVFFAVVGRPALKRTSDAGLTEVMGRLHEVGDIRMPMFGATALVSTLALVFTTGIGSSSSLLALLALAGLGTQLVSYLGVARAVNMAQTAAAQQGITPPNARELQRRWESVITLRAVGTLVGVASLAVCALSLR
jgi:dihydrodipicolinate synthase/N-acetylneuraminate lyase